MRSPFVLAFVVVGFAAALRRDQQTSDDDSPSSESKLCTPEVVEEASVLLGGASKKEGLRHVLALDENEVDSLFSLLELSSSNFTYTQLCEHAVDHIRDVLHVAPPHHLDESCLSADCSSTVNVSESSLKEQAPVSEEELGAGTQEDDVASNASGQGQPVQYTVSSAQLLRRLLSVVFHVFPDVDVETDIESPGHASLIDNSGSPMFDPSVNSKMQSDLKTQYAKATAMVASALRKIDSGRHYVEKRFKTSGRATDAQLEVTRRHLNLVFDSLAYAYVKYVAQGKEHCIGGTFAYVFTNQPKPPVNKFKVCGTKAKRRFLVHYCEKYIGAIGRSTTSAWASIVIHEHSHHFCSQDNFEKGKAVDNVNNYAYIARDLAEDASLRITRPAPKQKQKPPAAPAPAPKGGGGGGGGCFPPTALVHVAPSVAADDESCRQGVAERPAALLSPGDELRGMGNNVNSYILDFHEGVVGSNTSLTTYLRVEHDLQKAGRPLLITGNHLVFVAGASHDSMKLVPASELRPGKDALIVLSTDDSHSPGGVKTSFIKSIDRVVLPGFSAPLSSDGTLFVEGVLVSSYALLSDAQLALWQRGPSFFRDNAQSICHMLTYPFRLAHAFGLGSSFLQGLSEMFDGLSAGVLMLGRYVKFN